MNLRPELVLMGGASKTVPPEETDEFLPHADRQFPAGWLLMLPVVKWIGTAAGIAGAALLAVNVQESGWGFIFFLISSLAWLWVGLVTRDHALSALQGVFVGLDILGIVRWLL